MHVLDDHFCTFHRVIIVCDRQALVVPVWLSRAVDGQKKRDNNDTEDFYTLNNLPFQARSTRFQWKQETVVA